MKMMMMMRVAPAAKAFAFVRAAPLNRQYVRFTALRMMSAVVAPPVKVCRVDEEWNVYYIISNESHDDADFAATQPEGQPSGSVVVV